MQIQNLHALAFARNEAQLSSSLGYAAQTLGFNYYTGVMRIAGRDGRMQTKTFFHNVPAQLLERIRASGSSWNDAAYNKQKNATLPWAYDQAWYLAQGQSWLWEEVAAFGYHFGMTAAVALSPTKRFMLFVDRASKLPPQESSQYCQLLASIHLLAAHAGIAAEQLTGAQESAQSENKVKCLTPRELDVLKWMTAGKSSWEIGRILGLSENTVNFHIKNFVRKLRVSNRVEAGAKAAVLGLI